MVEVKVELINEKALFTTVITGKERLEELPWITLARTVGAKGNQPDGRPACTFRLDKLAEHASHAPPFSNDALRDKYVARVKADIEKGMVEYHTPKPVIVTLYKG